MVYFLIGYIWLFVHRPFEIWKFLGVIRLERVYAILCILYWLFLYPRKTWTRNRLNAAFGFFWFVFLAAWLTSPFLEAEGSTKILEEYAKYVVVYLLLMGTARTAGDLKSLVVGFVIVMGLYMTHSLREFHNGRHMFRMGIVRMCGVDESFSDPNTFAASALYALPIAVALWPEARKWWQKLLLTYYMGLTLLCIILTGSRGSFAGLACYSLFAARSLLFRNKKLLLLLAVSAPFAWTFVPEKHQNRFLSIINPSLAPKNAQQSAEERKLLFIQALGLWEQRPVLGFGPSSFSLATGEGMQPHNLYGQTLAETGILGAVALLGVVACFVANHLEVRRLRRQEPSGGDDFPVRLSVAILVSITILVIKGYGDHSLYRYTWLWYGAFQGIAVQCMRQRSALSGFAPRPVGQAIEQDVATAPLI